MENNTKNEKHLSLGKDFAAEEKMLKESPAPKSSISQAKRGRTLDEIWGIKKNSQYLAKTEEEYKGYLRGLNRCDIQAECIKQSIPPRDNRDMMTTALVKEFRKYSAKMSTPNMQPKKIEITPEVYKLLERATNNIV